MSRGLPLEQPPITDDPQLTEWLTRMFILVTSEFERGIQLEPQGYLPDKVQEGMVRYFKGEPTLEDGPHYYNGTEWVPMFFNEAMLPVARCPEETP